MAGEKQALVPEVPLEAEADFSAMSHGCRLHGLFGSRPDDL